ncbi:hypothetical protein AGLY_012115 [Aphis glycines]|uniref:Uncharacterized protein n=1 Tax=Aphis glycines TaxID=307491 RepID=A0A6G0TBC7_APHGL|nr:hypothetical protein AGLY_012115 [Aphis glycines]
MFHVSALCEFFALSAMIVARASGARAFFELNMDRHTILKIMDYLSSSDSDDDEIIKVERSTVYNIVEMFEKSMFSANKCCLRDVSERFGVGLTTQFRINNRVMDFLVDISATIINFNEGTVNLSREFQSFILEVQNTLVEFRDIFYNTQVDCLYVLYNKNLENHSLEQTKCVTTCYDIMQHSCELLVLTYHIHKSNI